MSSLLAHVIIIYKKRTAVEVDGRQDFNNTILEVILEAGDTSDDYTRSIPITRDEINEANEGFMIVMRANEEKSNPEDIKNLEFQDNGVTLGVITDDDSEYTSALVLVEYSDVLYVDTQSGLGSLHAL